MSTTTQQQGAPAPAKNQQQGGLFPGKNPNVITGAAVHHDLYRVGPAAEKEDAAALRSQARKLGIAFLVFFTLIIGGLSLSLNGLWRRDRAMVVPVGGELHTGLVQDEGGAVRLDPASGAQVHFTDGSAAAGRVVPAGEAAPPALAAGEARVAIYADRAHVGWVYAPAPAGALPARVELTRHHTAPSGGVMAGYAAPAHPACIHAWRTAKLAHTVPTRYLMVIGLCMGALGLVAPVVLVPFYTFWMKAVAAPLGWFNTRLILSVVWFLMFTPMAIFFWLRRKVSPQSDSLRRAPLPKERSYWIEKDAPRDRKHFERLF